MFPCTMVKKRGLNVRIIEAGLRRDDEQGGFKAGSGYIDQIFTLSQIGVKAREKKRRVYMGFMYLEKAYDSLIWKLCGRR